MRVGKRHAEQAYISNQEDFTSVNNRKKPGKKVPQKHHGEQQAINLILI